MGITVTSLKNTISLVLTDIKNYLTDSQPFLSNSFLRAIGVAMAGRKYDSDITIKQVAKGRFPQTADDDDLQYLGDLYDIYKNPASKSSGSVVATGTAGRVIPAGYTIIAQSGQSYTTKADATIGVKAYTADSLTGTSTLATFTSLTEHNLATGMVVTVSGASDSVYNGSKTITVLDEFTFSYPITSPSTMNPTGTIAAASTNALIQLGSDDFGAITNANSGETLTITTPISGVIDTVTVTFDGISGGTDAETTEDFRARVVEAMKNSVSNFNDYAIEKYIKDNVSGVTRMWILDETPDVGQVTVYFVRDGDSDIYPSPSAVDQVREELLKIKPAQTADEDVIVSAPEKLEVDFVFTDLVPDTVEMRDAVENSLTAFFQDNTNVGEPVFDKAYIAAIYNSVGTTSGAVISDFTLSSPSGDITVDSDELPALGTVSYT